MLLGVANNRHANAQLLGCGPLRNCVRRVVRSLRVDGRSQFSEQRFHIWLLKSHYIIDFAKRGNSLPSINFAAASRMSQLAPADTSARIALSNSPRVTTAVPRFITTRP